MSDLITVMNEGRVQQTANPAELYERPANLFVAGFVGSPSMNLMSGRIRNADGPEILIEVDSLGDGLVRASRTAAMIPGTEVVVGFRPDSISLPREDAGERGLPVPCKPCCHPAPRPLSKCRWRMRC